jgi:hypothetical protein
MRGGYMARPTDVQHSAEESTDSILPMMHLKPKEPFWRKKALRLAELFRTKWTGTNERGFLQFKNIFFSSRGVPDRPQSAADSAWNVKAVQPVLLYWQRTRDKDLTALFSQWMDTWVDAAAREERGKPAGVLPNAIHWPSGRVGGRGGKWWIPRIYGTKLYHWPSSVSAILETLVLTWHMTGDEAYLAPVRSMATLRLEHLKNPPEEDPTPGSRAWCAARARSVLGAVVKYKFLSGSTEFDELIAREAGGAYRTYRLTGDMTDLRKLFKRDARALSHNFPLYTSEVRYNDRVLVRPYRWFVVGEVAPETPYVSDMWTMSKLYSSVTGDLGAVRLFPLKAVRWLTSSRQIAALVQHADTVSLDARLFHFGDKPRPMAAEFYLLKPGTYTVSLARALNGKTVDDGPSVPDGPVVLKKTLVVRNHEDTRVEFVLPPGGLCALSIREE